MLATARWMSQLIGFLILISMIFVLLSVGSYSLDDPAWNHYTSREGVDIENVGGRVGAFLADWGLQLFGSTVFVFIACTVLGAICLMRARIRPVIGVAWRGLLLLLAVSTLAHLYWVDDPFFEAGLLAGGVSGQWLAEFLVPYLNVSGTYAVVGLSVLWVLLSCLRSSLFKGVRHMAATGRLTRGRRASDESLLFDEDLDPRSYPSDFQNDDDSGVSPDEMISEQGNRAAKISKPPSFLAQRAMKSQQRSQVSAREAISEKVDWEEASRFERPVPEDNVADLNADRAAPSEAPAPEVSILQPLPVKHVTPLQPPQLPSLDLLDAPLDAEEGQSDAELMEQARFLEQKLREFGVEGEVVQVSPGPVITMYEFAPAAGVKVNKIANLQDDLALVMRALSVRIVAPVPGKAVVGIEVPNVRRETIALRSLVDTEEFQGSSSKLSIVLGEDILGQPVITDLALIPHLLVAGATGSGKSVGLNSVICSLLFRVTPAEVRLIMIDPKMLEFSIYDGIPHLLVPVVTDAKKAAVALRRVVAEMERRYQLLASKGVRSIAQYNQKIRDEQARSNGGGADAKNPSAPAEPLPYLVVVVDELSDLMMVSSREVEDSLMRIAQMARAAGIHLIVATQRPSVDVLTGVIKANFPARLSFQVTSKTDSRTILDANGAETLLGRGDMLFLAPGTSKPQRVHGAYVSEQEIARLVAAWKAIEQPDYNDSFLEPINERVDDEDGEYDEKYDEAVALVARTGQASISMLQRRLRVGYNRAARMIEVMEKEGVVGPADGVKPREVLVRDTYDEV